MWCECGCGLGEEEDAEDKVTQYLIEEACQVAFDVMQAAEAEREAEESKPAPKPGEITDPVMIDALEQAKALHRERWGSAHGDRR